MEGRVSCPDGACPGVVGPDGRCGVCGAITVRCGHCKRYNDVRKSSAERGARFECGNCGSPLLFPATARVASYPEVLRREDGRRGLEPASYPVVLRREDGRTGFEPESPEEGEVIAVPATAVVALPQRAEEPSLDHPATFGRRSAHAVEARVLCPDGACVGVVGPDGRCRVCGRTEEGARIAEESRLAHSSDQPERAKAVRDGGGGLGEMFGCLSYLLILALLVGAVYVPIHFIIKYW
jgi:hypothetical protein